VVNVFNLSEKSEVREIIFDLKEIGLNPKSKIGVKGASYNQEGPAVILRFDPSRKRNSSCRNKPVYVNKDQRIWCFIRHL